MFGGGDKFASRSHRWKSILAQSFKTVKDGGDDWAETCTATACDTGYNLYNGGCYGNTRDCNIYVSDAQGNKVLAGEGTQDYLREKLEYGPCQANSCVAGYDTVESQEARDKSNVPTVFGAAQSVKDSIVKAMAALEDSSDATLQECGGDSLDGGDIRPWDSTNPTGR